MASSFATQQHQTQQHQACNQPAGLEIKLIASSFVKQYYTLLNKAPCFIHNFYNHDSTFIHGTIEMGNEHHTEPVVGREQIESKMKELKLNDCRAKIKQIDCLETLSNGLLIQVIGELSNNGRPMRRFLQTFVLASSPDPDGDSKAHVRSNTSTTTNSNNTAHDNRRSVQISENSTSSSQNQKFYVLNSIFRYQDDGPDSEFEDDGVSVQANTSIESAKNGPNEINDDIHNSRAKPNVKAQQSIQQSVASTPTTTMTPTVAAAKQPTVPEPSVAEPSKRTEPAQTTSGPHNGAPNVQAFKQSEKKIEIPDKAPSENGDSPSNDNQSQIAHPPSGDTGAPSTTAANQSAASSNAAQQSSAPAPRPSNEPKTWADMVRNALPQSAASVQNAPVSSSKDSQQASPNQSLQTQNNQPNSQNQTQNEVQNAQSSTNSGNNNNNNSNNNKNRRRHMIRKPANKAGAGRPMKKNTAVAQSVGRRTQ